LRARFSTWLRLAASSTKRRKTVFIGVAAKQLFSHWEFLVRCSEQHLLC
jgi:hypothetical protein